MAQSSIYANSVIVKNTGVILQTDLLFIIALFAVPFESIFLSFTFHSTIGFAIRNESKNFMKMTTPF